METETEIAYFQNPSSTYRKTIETRESEDWFLDGVEYVKRGENLVDQLLEEDPDFNLGDVDISVSAGGMNGYVATAMWSLLRPLQERGRVNIMRAKGSSAGGISAFLILKNIEVLSFCCSLNSKSRDNIHYWCYTLKRKALLSKKRF